MLKQTTCSFSLRPIQRAIKARKYTSMGMKERNSDFNYEKLNNRVLIDVGLLHVPTLRFILSIISPRNRHGQSLLDNSFLVHSSIILSETSLKL